MYRRAAGGYENKPFKPPSIGGNSAPITAQLTGASRRRPDTQLSQNAHRETPGPAMPLKRALDDRTAPPAKTRQVLNTAMATTEDVAPPADIYYAVLFRKKTTKKHKTWDGEGLLIVHANGTSTFKCDTAGGTNLREEGRKLSKVNVNGIISIGNFEVEVDHVISDPHELSQHHQADRTQSSGQVPARPHHIQAAPVQKMSLPRLQLQPLVPRKPLSSTSKTKRSPLYDPSAEDAFVMPRPPSCDNSSVIDVVVDPAISTHLRGHQKEGVIFLYKCVMGHGESGGTGALLADEMGLGKTLMTIALIWTLLRQSPLVERTTTVSKVLIACPVTLIGNWKKEFKKWLGPHKASVVTINGSNTVKADKLSIINFGKTRVYQVLIMGYEKIMTMADELDTVKFDLLICDEGHRLKSGQGKTLKILNGLDIDKRVLLTGTPIQNDLSEFYNIINFVNPGVLGTLSKFQREYMKPILRAREINCKNDAVIEMGEAKSNQLIELTKEFILRRTNSILTDYLPPKTDVIVFARPTKLQLSLFEYLMDSSVYSKTLSRNNYNDSLSLIMLFRKICNSPSLVVQDKLFHDINSGNGKSVDLTKKVVSGKIKVVIQLLNQIRKLDEKVVLISNFTQTLDVLQDVIKQLGFTFLRLDGSTQNKMRDRIVADFNKSSADGAFVFLLSAKSGGVGLNLIGASRLILFDNDWNPAIDLQAMARVHRDGQKKPVFIYRLLTTGAIDEKIFQRQLMKSNLSDKFLDGKTDSKDDVFDYNDLKDLFTLDKESESNTHQLLECECSGLGEDLSASDEQEEDETSTPETKGDDEAQSQNSWMSALDYKQLSQDPIKKRNAIKNCLADYKHLDPAKCEEYEDEVLTKIMTNEDVQKCISYMFMRTSKRFI